VRRFWSWIWALAPAWTLGIATPGIMVHAAVRLRDRRQWATVPVYVAAWILMLLFADGNGNDNNALFGIGMAVGFGIGTVHAIAIRSRVFATTEPDVVAPGTTAQQQAHAIAEVRAAAEARDRARTLIADNPALARELCIGRPDRPGRDYPDGGLVDVNHVPGDVLTGALGMPAELAQRIIATRTEAGAFASYDELLMLLDSDGHDTGEYAYRMCFVPDA
jgi:hypothetical protein